MANFNASDKNISVFDKASLDFLSAQNELYDCLKKNNTANVTSHIAALQASWMMMKNTVTPSKSLIFIQYTEEMTMIKNLVVQKNKK
jgi:hypothetical protein